MFKILSTTLLIFFLSFISVLSQIPKDKKEIKIEDIPEPAFVQELINKLPPHMRMNVPPYHTPEFILLLQENLTQEDMQFFKKNFQAHIKQYFPGPPPIAFTEEILMQLHRLSDIQVSPDGRSYIYNVGKPDIRLNKVFKDIYYSDTEGMVTKKLTIHAAQDYNGRWSPDGSKIAYISTRKGSPQIYIMDYITKDENSVLQITDLPEGVSNLSWSPDGKWLSFTSDVKINKSLAEKYPDYPEANLLIYDNLPVRHWDSWVDEKFSHLFIIPSVGGTPIDLMEGEAFDCPLMPFGGVEQIDWSKDSKEIAYTSRKVIDYELSTNSDIYVVNIESKKTKNITQGMLGYDRDPLYSPDGKWIAFHSQERAGFESDRVRLMLYDRNSGEIKELSSKLDQWVGETIWHPNSKILYFSAEDGPVVKIYEMDLSGDYKTITDGWYDWGHGINISPDGKKLYVGRESMLEPLEYYTMDLSNKALKQVTFQNDGLLANVEKPTIRDRWVESTDGKKVHCWLVMPPNFDSTRVYPMITYCQGGPQSTISQRFHYRWNMRLMASKGYLVMAPNRRGLPGFGQEWNDAISQDWGGQPMNDIIACTDAVSEEKWVNKKALSAVGASAGGYAVFWLAGHHDGRFKAFISHCGVFNLESMYGSTEELFFPNWEYGGPYWQSEKIAEHYTKNSPNSYIKNWDTPIMISTGGRDFRVPFTQSLEAFTAAQVQGVPSKLIYLPDESHFIAKPQEYIVWSNEFFAWLDKYCKY